MPRIRYIKKRFHAASLKIIDQANGIIKEYVALGFDLTLRQVYYQFVARDLLSNTLQDYKRLGSLLNDARLAGLIDWNALVDRTRNLQGRSHWNDPADIIEGAARSYSMDLWEGQAYRPEVWIEKDALLGVIEGVCTKLDVPFFSCRGYTSQSEMWRAAQRLKGYYNNERTCESVIIHLGDHDPSGIDMSRDIEDRLSMFGVDLEFVRIALNRDQIDKYNPPPNPAKITDSRAANYISEHGEDSWELDALDPKEMEILIEEAILKYRDEDLWDECYYREAEGRATLRKVIDRWGDVQEFLTREEE